MVACRMVDNNQLSGELPNSLGYAPALQILWVPLSKEILNKP